MRLLTIVKDKNFLRNFSDIALFSILILGFHFFFRFWANQLHYWPIQDIVNPVYEYLTNLLFHNSVWALKHLTNYEFTTHGRDIFMGSGYVGVHYGCSGLKPLLEWIFLMTIFPGPWKYKLWFIPLGLIIIHLVNIFRISGLSILLLYFPKHWQFTHDYIFRPFFYVVMFFLWVWWVEVFRDKVKSHDDIEKKQKAVK